MARSVCGCRAAACSIIFVAESCTLVTWMRWLAGSLARCGYSFDMIDIFS